MDRQERLRRFQNFMRGQQGNNTGTNNDRNQQQGPRRPTRVEDPSSESSGATRQGAPDNESDGFDIWNFEPPEYTETLEVSPNGTQRATKRARQGNEDIVRTQTQAMYNDRESERRMRQQMEAERMAHQVNMQRMRQEYELNREQMKAQKEAARRDAEMQRERQHHEAEIRRSQEKARREEERLRMEEEAEHRRLEAAIRRRREAVEQARRDAEAARQHEREMFRMRNTADMTDRLTDTRIRQAEAIMRQAQDRVRFQDQRAREYAGRINIARMQRGERFDRDVALIFAEFGLEPPNVETMRQPSVSQEIPLQSRRGRYYVYSRLVTGVRRINQADNNGFVEFLNGERLTLPGTAEGLLTIVTDVMPYVHVIHVYQFTPEFLASHGHETGKGPFDCCMKTLRCNIQ